MADHNWLLSPQGRCGLCGLCWFVFFATRESVEAEESKGIRLKKDPHNRHNPQGGGLGPKSTQGCTASHQAAASRWRFSLQSTSRTGAKLARATGAIVESPPGHRHRARPVPPLLLRAAPVRGGRRLLAAMTPSRQMAQIRESGRIAPGPGLARACARDGLTKFGQSCGTLDRSTSSRLFIDPKNSRLRRRGVRALPLPYRCSERSTTVARIAGRRSGLPDWPLAKGRGGLFHCSE